MKWVNDLSQNWLHLLLQKLKDIKDDRKQELESISEIFGDPLELAKYYVDPEIQQVNPADENENDPISTVRSPAMQTLNNFFKGDFIRSDDGRTILFILADAGMGKTSLLVMIKILNLTSFMPQPYSCSLLKLEADSIKKIVEIKNKNETVLLLDALDEDPSCWGLARDRVLELIEHTRTFHRVIVTCRTQFFPKDEIDPFRRPGRLKVGPYVSPVFFLSLFNDKQVGEYLHKRFNNTTIINKAKEIVRQMGSFRSRPLLLSYADAFLDATIDFNDSFSVYDALIKTWLDREERKLRESGKNISADDLLEACIHTALLMEERRDRLISAGTILDVINKIPTLKNLHYLDVGGRSLLNRTSEGNFRFSHYSIQEYLLSYGIINNLFKKRYPPIKPTNLMIDFIFARLDKTPNLKLIDLFEIEIRNKKINDISFSNGNMVKSVIADCEFTKVQFDKSILRYSSIFNCSFNNCSFIDSDLEGSDINNSVFNGSNLNSTNFRKSEFKDVSFHNCQLIGSAFDDTKSFNMNLNSSNFSKVSFQKAEFDKSKFHDSIFSESNFSTTNLNKVDILNSMFKNALFENAEFLECNAKSIDFFDSKLSYMTCSKSNFDNSIFHFDKINECYFLDCSFDGANFEKSKKVFFFKARLLKKDLTTGEYRVYIEFNGKKGMVGFAVIDIINGQFSMVSREYDLPPDMEGIETHCLSVVQRNLKQHIGAGRNLPVEIIFIA